MKIIYEKMLDIIIDSIFKEMFLHIFMLLHVFIKFGAAMVDMIFAFCIFMYYFCISDFAIFRVFFLELTIYHEWTIHNLFKELARTNICVSIKINKCDL